MRGRQLPIKRKVLVDFWLDLALFVAFILDYAFRFTGLTIHEWIGLGMGVGLIAHLALHWDWVVKVTTRLARSIIKLRLGRDHLRWLVDLFALLSLGLAIVSGVIISRKALSAVGLAVSQPDRFWTDLHVWSADLTIFAVALHIALSWKWIWSVVRRLVGAKHSTPAGAVQQ